jgi:NADPH-dependent 2,4-dienoyl-CoA reductase/sulfur reductase-like enzyme
VLKSRSIGKNAFNTGDMRERILFSRDAITIGIDTDSRVAAKIAPAQSLIKENARRRINRRMNARRDHVDADPGVTKRFGQIASSDVATAASPHIPWNGGYEMKQAHVRRLEPAADDTVIGVLVPRAVPAERFYRSRRRHKARETARTLLHTVSSTRHALEHLRAPAYRPPSARDSGNVNSKPVPEVYGLRLRPGANCFVWESEEGRVYSQDVHTYDAIVLGGGMVAGYAAKEAVEGGLKAGQLAIVSADEALPYERPPLSKSFLAGKDNDQSVLINNESFYREHGIDIHLNLEIQSIDLSGKRLLGESGREFGFKKLILATGARVRPLDVPGADRGNVLYLRSLGDSVRLRDALRSAKKVAVVGASFIGMEVASQSAQQGRETVMVFPQDRVWKSFFTPEMSQFFAKYYQDRGVRLVPEVQVAEIGEGSVSLSSGAKLDADLVVAGVGVTPVTQIAEAAGLPTNNGVLVNEFLETSAPNVYAAGDMARYHDVLSGKQRRLEHWDNAVKQGQYLAQRLRGETEPFKNIPYFFSDVFDLSYEFWGSTEDAERTEYRGDLNSSSFSAWWFKGDSIVAAFAMNRPDAEREAASRLAPIDHSA